MHQQAARLQRKPTFKATKTLAKRVQKMTNFSAWRHLQNRLHKQASFTETLPNRPVLTAKALTAADSEPPKKGKFKIQKHDCFHSPFLNSFKKYSRVKLGKLKPC